MSEKIGIAVFVSGGGSNLQAIIDACDAGSIPGQVVLVVSNKKKAGGLIRATKAGIDTVVHKRKKFPSVEKADQALLKILKKHYVDLIATAGYLQLLPASVIDAYRGRILNIHPALLPRYGGKGMYGLHVHRAVLEAGDKESGATVHKADEIYDHGQVVAQEKVPVVENDTPESLAARVLEAEHKLYPRIIAQVAEEILKGIKK